MDDAPDELNDAEAAIEGQARRRTREVFAPIGATSQPLAYADVECALRILLPGWAPPSVYQNVHGGWSASLAGGAVHGEGDTPLQAAWSAVALAVARRIQLQGQAPT